MAPGVGGRGEGSGGEYYKVLSKAVTFWVWEEGVPFKANLHIYAYLCPRTP